MRALAKFLLTSGILICTSHVAASETTAQHADDAALKHAHELLGDTILIDGHNDLPWALRSDKQARGQVNAYDLRQRTSGQTDLARLHQGGVGGQFWSVYIPSEFVNGFVRTQLEQIDLARRLIERYPDALQLALTAEDIGAAHRNGRIASLLGIEGGHAIENSLGALRAYYDLGVRYMTLTHVSNNDWADSATDTPRHHGLTSFGEEVVHEMNRLGMLVDLSHTSPETMRDALMVSRAPVIFSHSAARALVDVPRNVPDEILRMLPKNGGIVMLTFVSAFVDPEVARKTGPLMLDLIQRARQAKSENEVEQLYKNAFGSLQLPVTSIERVADHIEYIRKVAGIDHIGLGSDFDGNDYWPQGLEDVSGYPNLFAELIRRGWTDRELKMLAGENLLRVMEHAQSVAVELQKSPRADLASAAPGIYIPQPACNSLPAGAVEHSTRGLQDAQPNMLASDESPRQWHLLFDGRSFKGWSGFQRSTIPSSWRVEQGTLTLSKLNEGESFEGRGDLRTTAPFENFELRLQWIAASGSNSGIFFFGRESAADRLWQVAPEMQVLDDVVSEDNLAPSHRAGGLYDLYAPKCNALRPAGEFNDVRLVVRNGHVEHWLNGYRIVEYDLDSPDFRSRVALSKFRDMPQFAKLHRGFVALQDHGDVIRFRNVRIHAF